MDYPAFTFIRDDDVWRCSNNFLSVFNLLEKNQIPVILGIIPNKANKELVDFLNKKKENKGYSFDIVQHGWAHKDYSRGRKNKYEFGSSRSYAQQKKDILGGYNKMEYLFGKNFTPAFIPPYHGYNQNTLKIIEELKIPLFSAGKKTKIKRKKFLDLPAQISLNNYAKDGTPLQIEAKKLIKKVSSSLSGHRLSGMVFHHHAIKNNMQLQHFSLFVRFLRKRKEEKKIKTILFKQLLSKNNFSGFRQ